MAHLTNFSFEFFYEVFTKDASLCLLYHGAKKSKTTKNSNQGGSCLNLVFKIFVIRKEATQPPPPHPKKKTNLNEHPKVSFFSFCNDRLDLLRLFASAPKKAYQMLTQRSRTTSSLDLTLTPPLQAERNGLLVHYLYQYKRVSPVEGNFSALTRINVSPSTQEDNVSISLTGLNSNALYTIRVQACTQSSSGDHCSTFEMANFTTLSSGESPPLLNFLRHTRTTRLVSGEVKAFACRMLT